MSLRGRLRRLERRCGAGRPAALVLFLEPPDGGPDRTCLHGQWQAVADVAAFREQYRGVPLTVVAGIDPLVVVGDKPGIDPHRGPPP